MQKHLLLLGISIALLFLLIATIYYPGGSSFYSSTSGFDWVHNYLSDLFGDKAINGMDNGSRWWAVAGMLFLCISFGGFFLHFSQKISSKPARITIMSSGIGAMLAAFLTVSPLHDAMIPLSSTLVLIAVFYITVMVLRSRLHVLKILSILFLLFLYANNYVYFSQNYVVYLPLMQKVVLLMAVIWVGSLSYGSTEEDFQPIR